MKAVEITHSGFDLNKDIIRYVEKKADSLIKFIPRASRREAHFEVKLKEEPGHHKNKCTAEMILHLPRAHLMVKESTINIFAAIDIIDAKMAVQLRKYKEQNVDFKRGRGRNFIRRIRRVARVPFRHRR